MCKYILQNECFLVRDLINEEMGEIEIYKFYLIDRKVYHVEVTSTDEVYEFMCSCLCYKIYNKLYTSTRLIFILYVQILHLILSALSLCSISMQLLNVVYEKLYSYSSRYFELSNKPCIVQK